MGAATIDAHFELYGLRDGRWVLDACFADEQDAFEEAARLARSAGVRGTRVVREAKLSGVDAPIVTVLLDTTSEDVPTTPKPPAVQPASGPSREHPADGHPAEARLGRAPARSEDGANALPMALLAGSLVGALGIGLTLAALALV